MTGQKLEPRHISAPSRSKNMLEIRKYARSTLKIAAEPYVLTLGMAILADPILVVFRRSSLRWPTELDCFAQDFKYLTRISSYKYNLTFARGKFVLVAPAWQEIRLTLTSVVLRKHALHRIAVHNYANKW